MEETMGECPFCKFEGDSHIPLGELHDYKSKDVQTLEHKVYNKLACGKCGKVFLSFSRWE